MNFFKSVKHTEKEKELRHFVLNAYLSLYKHLAKEGKMENKANPNLSLLEKHNFNQLSKLIAPIFDDLDQNKLLVSQGFAFFFIIC